LAPGGVIVLKDNMLLDGSTFLWDLADSSMARHRTYMELLLTLAGLTVVLEMQQSDFPEELLPVMMWAISAAPKQIC
jgi:protein N-terminal methyltransferase